MVPQLPYSLFFCQFIQLTLGEAISLGPVHLFQSLFEDSQIIWLVSWVFLEDFEVSLLPFLEYALQVLVSSIGPGFLDEILDFLALASEYGDLLVVSVHHPCLGILHLFVFLLLVDQLALVPLARGFDGCLKNPFLFEQRLMLLHQQLVLPLILIMTLQTDAIVRGNLLELAHFELELVERIGLLSFECLASELLVLELTEFFIQVCQPCCLIIDLFHGLGLVLLDDFVETLFSPDLIIVQLPGEPLLILDFQLCISEAPLQIDQKLRILNFFKSSPQLRVLSHKIGHSFVGVHDFLIGRSDSRRTSARSRYGALRPRWTGSSGHRWVRSTQILLLLESFLVHFLNQDIDIVAHSPELISKLLVLILQVLFLLVGISQAVHNLLCILHLLELLFGLHQSLLDELIRISFLYCSEITSSLLRGVSHHRFVVI